MDNHCDTLAKAASNSILFVPVIRRFFGVFSSAPGVALRLVLVKSVQMGHILDERLRCDGGIGI